MCSGGDGYSPEITTPPVRRYPDVGDTEHRGSVKADAPLWGRLFKLTPVVMLVGSLFGDYALYFLLVPALLMAGISVVYSYYVYEQLEGGLDSELE